MWIDVRDRLPTTAGPFKVKCPAAGNGKYPEDIRYPIYFNVEQGRLHRCLETQGIFRCIRIVSHWWEEV